MAKKKTKKILKSKGGWIGAVLMLIIVSLPAIYSDAQSIPKIVQWIGNLPIYGPSFVMMLVVYIISVVLGFIIGRFIEKKIK